MPLPDRVLMAHPALPDSPPVDVGRLQFEGVWAALGWTDTAATTDEPAADPAPQTPADTAPAAPAKVRGKAAVSTVTADPSAPATPADTPKGTN